MIPTQYTTAQLNDMAYSAASKDSYKIRTSFQNAEFSPDKGSLLQSTHCINYTPENIYIYPFMSERGDNICSCPAFKPGQYVTGIEACFVIRGFVHEGHYYSLFGKYGAASDLKVNQVEITIPYSRLHLGVIYIEEFDCTISIETFKDRIKLCHPGSSVYKKNKSIKEISELVLKNKNQGVYINANDPTNTHPYVYTVINGFVCCFKTNNDPTLPASVTAIMHSANSDRPLILDFDASKVFAGCNTFEDINGNAWTIGIQHDLVATCYREHDKNKLKSHVDQIITDSIKNLKEEYERKVSLLKKDNTLLQQENDQQRAIIEKHMAGLKATTEEKKLYFEDKKLHYEHVWDVEKREYERQIQELKVKQTQHSTLGSEASLIANIAKAAVVVVPIAATVMIAMKSSSSLAIKTATTAVPAVVSAVSNVICKTVSNVWDFISGFW